MKIIYWCDECKENSYKENVCTTCGLVLAEKPIDYGVFYSEKSAEERKQIMFSQFQKGIRKRSTIKISECKNPDLKRALRKYYYPWQDKRDAKVRDELKRIVGLLNLRRDFYVSCYYNYCKIAKYNEENKRNLFKGAGKVSIEIVAQGIAFLEIKKQKLPFTLKDFEKINCNKKDVQDYYKRLINEFNIKIEQPTPIEFIQKIVVALEIPPRKEYLLINGATTFLTNIMKIEDKMDLPTRFRNPIVKTGSAIYSLTSDVCGVTQKTICDIVGCNVQTLRKRVNEIKIIINQFFDICGVVIENYNETKYCGEYKPLVDNIIQICNIKEELANCFLNPKFTMNIAQYKNKLKPIFSVIK